MRFREAFFHDRDPRWTNIRHARELANCVITADWPLRVDLGHLADDISSQANFGLWLGTVLTAPDKLRPLCPRQPTSKMGGLLFCGKCLLIPQQQT
jgi:hypothetical protein